MARTKKKTIIYEVNERFDAMKAFGQKKHEIRKEGGNEAIKDKIFSKSTYDNYLHAGEAFAVWARDKHKCQNLESARQYTGEYLASRADKSAWTVARDAAALGKLYGCSSTDLGYDVPTRRREDVTQHRDSKWQGHFSEERNADLVALCRSSGLRRHEVEALRPEDVTQEDGRTYVHVRQGKGGKERYVECLDDAPYRIAQAAEGDRVIEHIPKYAPIHEYRREFAQELYDRYERQESELTTRDIYYCRGEMRGQRYDKGAMRRVSRSLGHERLEVVTRYLSHSGLTETETVTVTETEEVEEEADD